jgi:hypothetical protein
LIKNADLARPRTPEESGSTNFFSCLPDSSGGRGIFLAIFVDFKKSFTGFELEKTTFRALLNFRNLPLDF